MTDARGEAFAAERFRETGRRVVDALADYLARAAGADPALPVLPAVSPEVMVRAWSAPPTEAGGADALEILGRAIEGSNHLHHPGYVGHQVSAPLPLAALAELASALLNNGMAVYETGPAATAIERAVVRFLADRAGLPPSADGVLTSGGSAGNLTALLAARQARAGFDVWRRGLHAGPPLALLVSEQAHYCVRRAAGIMGLGEDGVFLVPTDERFRMRPDALPAALEAARAAGRAPFAVVASAGSTATGAHDPLPEIADFCAARGLWLHVDAAHGASALLSPRLAPRLAGIERADSIVWDAHKMAMMPALATAVLYRDGARSFGAFAQEASYLFDGVDPAAEWWNLGGRTLECTKRMMGLPLWVALHVYGTRFFAEHVERTYDLARWLAARLRAEPDFEVAHEPDANILCFRHRPDGERDLDALQPLLRRRVNEGGGAYLVQTRLRGATWLRVTLIGPATSPADLERLVAAIRAAV